MKKIEEFIHHFFVPHKSNDYRAKALHIDMLSSYFVMAIFVGMLWQIMPGSRIADMILGIATDINTHQLLQCTNAKRAENGLPPLTLSDKLNSAASMKAQDIFANNYWSHYGPTGTTPWQFILKSGYSYEFAGENLAKNFLFSNDVCDAWMNSPTHRENMLRDVYQNVGFAVVDGSLLGESTTLVVQMFGTPTPTSAAPTETAAAKQSEQKTEIETSPLPTQPARLAAQLDASPTSAQFSGTSIGQSSNQPKGSELFSRLSGADLLQYRTSIIFISILIVALISDLYWARKLGILKISGRHVAHLVFAAAILIGLVILSKGTITASAAFL